MSKIKTVKSEALTSLPEINLVPISNTVITSAFIVPEQATALFRGQHYQPTFQAIQRVYAVGPNVEFCKPGDWVYLDLNKYVKTRKKQSTIKAGIGGQDMITEEFVPPLWAAPNNDTDTFFKITDREIEGTITDPQKINLELDLFEDYLERIEKLDAESAKKMADETKKLNKELASKANDTDGRKGPMIITSTSPNLRD